MSVRTVERVASALRGRRPVVALETAVLTHGLPRACDDHEIDALLNAVTPVPFNARVIHAMTRAVRTAGAEPAVVGMVDGELVIGLDDAAIDHLAAIDDAVKLGESALAAAMAAGRSGGTTVSATLAGCTRATPAPIRVLATGGIGGVHRGWREHLDVSADLGAIARSAVAVVCSGAKSILDVPATMEALEALAVPVVGVGTRDLPLFQARGDGRVTLGHAVDTPAEGADLCRAHWTTLASTGGVVFTQPVPERHAMPIDILEARLAAAERAVTATGAERTPALLASLAHAEARVLRANVALLIENARWAAALATSGVR